MSARFGLFGAAAAVMIFLSSSSEATAAANQIVTISSVQYKAPAGGNPATAEPKGTYSVSAGGTYRVYVDYGTISNGVFTANANVSAGGPSGITISQAGGNYNWSVGGPQNLTNPPVGLYCRARLQQLNATNNTWVDLPAVTYAPCP